MSGFRALLDEIGVHVPPVPLPVARPSDGRRRAIAVARAVNSNTRVLLLDEPLAVMAAREAGLIIDLILRLKAKGEVSIVVIMHNDAQTLGIADHVMLPLRGRVTYENTARDVGCRTDGHRPARIPKHSERMTRLGRLS